LFANDPVNRSASTPPSSPANKAAGEEGERS
jgi:hypothetical protein